MGRFRTKFLPANLLISWLSDWLVHRLIGWLVDWLIDWFDWLIDWLIDWLTDWLIGWLIDWLDPELTLPLKALPHVFPWQVAATMRFSTPKTSVSSEPTKINAVPGYASMTGTAMVPQLSPAITSCGEVGCNEFPGPNGLGAVLLSCDKSKWFKSKLAQWGQHGNARSTSWPKPLGTDHAYCLGRSILCTTFVWDVPKSIAFCWVLGRSPPPPSPPAAAAAQRRCRGCEDEAKRNGGGGRREEGGGAIWDRTQWQGKRIRSPKSIKIPSRLQMKISLQPPLRLLQAWSHMHLPETVANNPRRILPQGPKRSFPYFYCWHHEKPEPWMAGTCLSNPEELW